MRSASHPQVGGHGRTVAAVDNVRRARYAPHGMGFENGKLLRVTLRASNGSDVQVNTLHYDLDDGDVIDVDNDPQTLADVFRDDVIPQWKTLYHSSWTIDPVVVTEELDPLNPTRPRSQWTSGSSVAGTRVVSGDTLPPNCNVLVKLNTAHIGRRFTGRLWLGGSVTEGDQANGSWVSSYLTGIATIMNAIPVQPDIALGSSGATADWCVYSRTQRAANLDPYAPHISSYTVRSLVHTLRTRALYTR